MASELTASASSVGEAHKVGGGEQTLGTPGTSKRSGKQPFAIRAFPPSQSDQTGRLGEQLSTEPAPSDGARISLLRGYRLVDLAVQLVLFCGVGRYVALTSK